MKAMILAALVAASVTTPALAADYYLFAYSPTGSQTLSLNGVTENATQTGWFDQSGEHGAGNSNYLTALAPTYGFPETRSFFTFAGATGVTSAILSLGNDSDGFLSSTGSPVTFTLYDVNNAINTDRGYAGATGIFDDLGTGVAFGSAVITGPRDVVTVNLNAAGIAAINAAGALNQSITFGGRLTMGVASPAPEPATWAMMILGFGLVGTALRRQQKAKVRVTFA